MADPVAPTLCTGPPSSSGSWTLTRVTLPGPVAPRSQSARGRELREALSESQVTTMTQYGRPPDRPGCPGRGDLPSGLSQGGKHRASDRDLPSNHSLGTSCSTSDRVGAAPNSSSLGVVQFPRASRPRVSCPAQPVGFICVTHQLGLGPTCPLGHTMYRAHVSAVRTPSSTL